jgi:hypothetical protein
VVVTTSAAEGKALHEDGALSALCAELTAQGRLAVIVEHPDRQPGSGLTVDAILDVDGVRWAVDHCLLSRASELPTRMTVAEKSLRDRLDAIALRFGVRLFVAYLPQPVAQDRKTRRINGIGSYYEALLTHAERAARTREPYLGSDGMAQVHLLEEGWGPGELPPVVLAPFTNATGSIFIGNEVDAGLREPLTKKLDRQFRPAKALGMRTMLLLDQIPRPGGGHTVWMASPRLVASTVSAILKDTGGESAIDEVWLRQPPRDEDTPRVCRVIPTAEAVLP